MMALRLVAAGLGAALLLAGPQACAQDALARAALYDAAQAQNSRCCVVSINDFQVNLRTAPVTRLLGGDLQTYMLRSADANGAREFGATGFTVHYPLPRTHFYLRGGLGAAIAGGTGIRLPSTPERLYLDNRVLFERDVALGWRVTRGWAVEAAYTRFSHGDLIGVDNPDPNSYGLRLAFHLRR